MDKNIFEMFSDLSSDFDEKYRKDKNFFQRINCWTEAIGKYVKKDMLVYDIGCGSGVFSFFTASKGARVTGMDGSKGMINLCNQKLNEATDKSGKQLQFVQQILPLPESASFEKGELILCSSVFEYIMDTDQMIATFKSLLNNHGMLLLSVPNKNSIYRKAEKIGFALLNKPSYLKHVCNRYSYQQLVQLFEQHQFVACNKYYYADNYFLSGILKMIFPEKYISNLILVEFKLNQNKN